MTDLTIRGNRHERRKATRLARKVQNGTSQRNITAAYNTWKRSGDARADSITFREFSVQRPDQNADYVPARWANWATRLQPQPETMSALDVEALVHADEAELAHEQFPSTVTLDDVVEMLQPNTALDLVVQTAAEEHGSIDAALNVKPKRVRKPRAKKTDEAAV